MSGGAEIYIDRLVLDIPGFDPAKAGSLAREIGQHLAAADIKPGQVVPNHISLALGPHGADAPDLALRIARALMQRLSP
jgi:hypothetical protein